MYVDVNLEPTLMCIQNDSILYYRLFNVLCSVQHKERQIYFSIIFNVKNRMHTNSSLFLLS